MNIAHIVFSFNTGGIENLLVDIFNNWNREDSLLLCIVNNSKNNVLLTKINQQNENVKVVCLGREVGGEKIQFIKKLEKVLSDFKVDCVHCHSNNVWKFCIPIKLKHLSWKFFLTVHDTNIYGNYKTIDYFLQRVFLHRLIVISSAVKKEVIEAGYPASKVRLVYNGIDSTKFIPMVKKNNIIKRIICVARLIPEKKGQDVLLKAIAEVKKKRSDFTCILVGEAPVEHPEYLKDIKLLIDELNIKDYVELLGNRNDVPELLSQADLFILPSRYEGFGISLVEAMFAGVPVIASAIDGPKEIIKENQYGYLFENENYKHLAKIIQENIDLDHSWLIEKSYKYVLENFSIVAMVKKMEQIYREK